MTRFTTYGWAVLTPMNRGWWDEGAPLAYYVARTRFEAMESFVADWRTSENGGQSISKVWQQAYRRGWRIARVAITPLKDMP